MPVRSASLLPGGRPLADPAARAEVEKAWGVSIPETPGRDTAGILEAVGIAEPELTDFGVAAEAVRRRASISTARSTRSGAPGLAGLLIGGVEISDLPDPAAALAAVASAGFVVSLEIRVSAVTELANVVFPVAAAAEKSGAYVNWEGRLRPFDAALPEAGMLDEARILDTLGVEMDVDLYTQTPAAANAEINRLGIWSGPRPEQASYAPVVAAARRLRLRAGVLADEPGRRSGHGRRAAPEGHRPAGRCSGLPGGGLRTRCSGRRSGRGSRRGQFDHPAGCRDTDAR